MADHLLFLNFNLFSIHLIFHSKQIELEHQKHLLTQLELDSLESWGALEKIPDAELEVAYAVQQLIESRDLLHELITERSNEIKQERFNR